MTKRKQGKAPEFVVPIDRRRQAGVVTDPPGFTDLPDDEDPDELSLMAAASELGGFSNATITIKKISANRDEEHCFQCSPVDFSIDRIRDEWGPGAYRIYGRKDDKIAFNKKLVLARPLEKPKVETPPPAPALDVRALIREMSEQFAKAQQSTVSELQKLIIIALSNNNRAPAMDPLAMQKNMLDGLVTMKSLIGGGDEKLDKIDILLQGIELARDLGGPATGAETNDVLMELVRKFGPPLAEMTLRGARAGGEAPTAPGGDRPALAVVPKKVQPKGGNEMLKLVGMLVNGAENGTDPISYADLIFDQVPVEQIQAFFAMGDPVATLEKLDKRVAAHRPWFEQLREYLKQGLQEAAEPDDNQPSTTEATTVETEQRTDKDIPPEAVSG